MLRPEAHVYSFVKRKDSHTRNHGYSQVTSLWNRFLQISLDCSVARNRGGRHKMHLKDISDCTLSFSTSSQTKATEVCFGTFHNGKPLRRLLM